MTVKPRDVLWTGGADSTYRVIDLAYVRREQVQPWYIDSLHGRLSTRHELRAMDRIREALRVKSPEAADRILPTKRVHDSEIPEDREITEKLRNLQARQHLGEQYGHLARFAKHTGITLELSSEKDGMEGLLNDRLYVDTNGDVRVKAEPDEDVHLFSYFAFPVSGLTKLDMHNLAEATGFGDLMELTWFCHAPVAGKACGFCRPCAVTRRDGVASRVPEPSMARFAAMIGWTIPRATIAYVRSGGKYWLGPKIALTKQDSSA